ncbi:hypothetical protein GCM10028801_17230 [Nocardioides maradonensis]
MNTRRWNRRGDDGVTMLLALLIITAIALVSSALLAQAFTNNAATIGTRKATANQYGADAAAQYVVNQVRLSDLSSGLCSTTGATSEDLANFYPAGTGTVAQKAHADCVPDPTNGVYTGDPGICHPNQVCPNAGPGTALLTLDPTIGETGIYVSSNAGPIKIRGGIFSNSKIDASSGGLLDSWCPTNPSTNSFDCTMTTPKTYVIAKGTCTGVTFLQAGATPTCNFAPTNDPRGADPGVARTNYTPAAAYGTPAAPTQVATSQSCTTMASCTPDVGPTPGPASSCGSGTKFQKVLPGVISGAAGAAFLNALSGCANNIVQFVPGTYYLDLPAGSPWSMPSKTTVVGGTFASGYNPVTGNGWGSGDYADACVAPGDPAASNSSGVQFVIGGATKININDSSGNGTHFTICASNSPDGPPIALYGLKTSIGSGPMAVSASSLCTPNGSGSTGCALIQTANSPKTTANIVGMTYATRSTIHIGINNSSSKLFYWGVVSYAVEFVATGSPSLVAPLVDVQNTGPSPFTPLNRFFLNVYVCPVAAASCPASGAAPNVKAVVQGGIDLSGNYLPPGNLLVLSWGVKR